MMSCSCNRRGRLAGVVLLFTFTFAAAADPGRNGAMVTSQAPVQSNGNANPGIAPPNSTPHGQTYGAWASQWWQWALSIPLDRNPLVDPDGRSCDQQQVFGPVWFLAGAGPGGIVRTCVIPHGKALLIPVYNWIFGAAVFDCQPSVPNVPCDVTVLRQLAADNALKAEGLGGVLEVIIDGKRVQNVRQYRSQSPAPFSITYPPNSLLGLSAGVYYPQVADGYWLMIEPLNAGSHTVQTHVLAPDTVQGTLEFFSDYTLIVQ